MKRDITKLNDLNKLPLILIVFSLRLFFNSLALNFILFEEILIWYIPIPIILTSFIKFKKIYMYIRTKESKLKFKVKTLNSTLLYFQKYLMFINYINLFSGLRKYSAPLKSNKFPKVPDSENPINWNFGYKSHCRAFSQAINAHAFSFLISPTDKVKIPQSVLATFPRKTPLPGAWPLSSISLALFDGFTFSSPPIDIWAVMHFLFLFANLSQAYVCVCECVC